MVPYSIAKAKVDGVEVFYRYAGPEDAPPILLLHGYPSSSHMFRNLIPLLSKEYRVYAPDLPGYGFTDVPKERDYKYTFDNLATTTEKFVDEIGLKRYAIYIFDYGAPVGERLALKHPDAISAIITQNGNAYMEGFGQDFWKPVFSYWKSSSPEERKAIGEALLNLEATKWQYVDGSADPENIQPEAYYLDQALVDRPGNKDIQLDLVRDYQSNVQLYPDFHKYLRESNVPVIAIWGKNDTIFVPPGAEAFKRDVEKFELHFVDAGHFALETNEVLFADLIGKFLKKNGI